MLHKYKVARAKKKLQRRIKEMLESGYDDEAVIKKALKVGWPQTTIDEILENLKEKNTEKEKTISLKLPIKKVEQPTTSENKRIGIGKKLDDINEQLELITQAKKHEKKLKKKNFKLPFKVKSQLKKLAVKNKIQVMMLQRNKNIKPTIGELKDGMLLIDNEAIHDCPMDCVGLWNGKTPTVILPEWDLKPLSLDKVYEETLKNKRQSDPQKIIIRSMEFKESQMPKKLSGKTIIWLIIGIAIVFGVLFMGGN